jgi:DNA-binding protein H-NS
MRKPRDIDAELRALTEKAKGLKTRKIAQLGELVIATGAETLAPEILAGVLLAAVETRAGDTQEAWRRRGAAFFQRQTRQTTASGAPSNAGGTAAGSSGEPPR